MAVETIAAMAVAIILFITRPPQLHVQATTRRNLPPERDMVPLCPPNNVSANAARAGQQRESGRDDNDACHKARGGTPVAAPHIAQIASDASADGQRGERNEAADSKHGDPNPVFSRW
jgi:hypothetical protein